MPYPEFEPGTFGAAAGFPSHYSVWSAFEIGSQIQFLLELQSFLKLTSFWNKILDQSRIKNRYHLEIDKRTNFHSVEFMISNIIVMTNFSLRMHKYTNEENFI